MFQFNLVPAGLEWAVWCVLRLYYACFSPSLGSYRRRGTRSTSGHVYTGAPTPGGFTPTPWRPLPSHPTQQTPTLQGPQSERDVPQIEEGQGEAQQARQTGQR